MDLSNPSSDLLKEFSPASEESVLPPVLPMGGENHEDGSPVVPEEESDPFESIKDSFLTPPDSPPPAPPDGIVESRDENGALTRQVTYAQGILEGECLVFNAQGKVIQKLFYHEGKLQGEVLMYNDEGDLIQRHSYDQGLLHGVTQILENKVILSETPYVKGVREGVGRLFAPNGRLQTETTFQGDKENGIRTIYNPETGDVVRKEILQKGIPEGQSLSFYPSGVPMMQQTFEKGLAEGYSVQFYENGKIQQITPYEKGVIAGSVKKFTPKGKEM